MLGECLAHGAGLLWTEIQRFVFLALKWKFRTSSSIKSIGHLVAKHTQSNNVYYPSLMRASSGNMSTRRDSS